MSAPTGYTLNTKTPSILFNLLPKYKEFFDDIDKILISSTKEFSTFTRACRDLSKEAHPTNADEISAYLLEVKSLRHKYLTRKWCRETRVRSKEQPSKKAKTSDSTEQSTNDLVANLFSQLVERDLKVMELEAEIERLRQLINS